MKKYNKKKFPEEECRKFLEASPTLLLSSSYKNQRNVMALGWYTVMEFSPSLIGCMISQANYSFELIKKSQECVLNIPEIHLAEMTVKIGNCSGFDIDKFDHFKIKTSEADLVKAPLVNDCFASFECKLYDEKLVKDYNFFIFEIVKAHVAVSPKLPKTFSYRGDSVFMESGRKFKINSSK